MNKQEQVELIRQQFRQYRRRIAELEAELDDQAGTREYDIARLESKARAYRQEIAEKERQAESDRWYREDQIKSITNELERARNYKDEWGESRAIEKLRRL